jgi:nucleoside-diphosphate-sugar epimerase
VGSTGFVGGHLARGREFSLAVHRSDLHRLAGAATDLLVCAGLPAEKWRANAEPQGDWANMADLAQTLATVRASRVVLVSTVDVYEKPQQVDEVDSPTFNAAPGYGAHRAWFETFVQARFDDVLVLRLPGLYAPDVRKNLVHDLLHGKVDQWQKVDAGSTFQFFDVTRIWEIIERAWQQHLTLLNVACEPVSAASVAAVFGERLVATGTPVHYDMRSIHAPAFGGTDGYLIDAPSALEGIAALRESVARA